MFSMFDIIPAILGGIFFMGVMFLALVFDGRDDEYPCICRAINITIGIMMIIIFYIIWRYDLWC